MARARNSLILGFGFTLIVWSPLGRLHSQEPDRIRSTVDWQAALDEGQALLKRGDYRAAVKILESKISLIDGNHRYLMALRDAYAGYVNQLKSAGNSKEMQTYLLRLQILDKGARGPAELARPEPAAPVANAPRPIKNCAKGDDTEDDPFAESNTVAAHRGRALVIEAERAFDAKNYEKAHKLYDQADRAMPDVSGDWRDRFAYCLLFRANVALDSADGVNNAELERDIKRGIGMSPKLEGWGGKLLGLLGKRGPDGGPAVEVKHTPQKGEGFAIAETANFRVFHTSTPAFAEKVALAAEAARTTAARKWLEAMPAKWGPRCDLYLHASKKDYLRATGIAEWMWGHSTITLEEGRVAVRRLDFCCDDPRLLDATLPHETTHVVLAGQFGRHELPRWADEGMAVLSEPNDRIEKHLANLPTHASNRDLFEIGALMQLKDYPAAQRVAPFYAQSISLVGFLCEKKGHKTFARFVRDCLDTSYETALRKHYGMESFAELDRLWRAAAIRDAAVARVNEDQ
jgi:hypothetical protein